MIRQWLTEAVKRTSHDKAVTLQGQESETSEPRGKQRGSQILNRAGAFAKRVVRSISTPGGIPSGNELFPKLPAEKSGAGDTGEAKAKAANVSRPH